MLFIIDITRFQSYHSAIKRLPAIPGLIHQFRFNPTIVRLKESLSKIVNSHFPYCFNPTIVRLKEAIVIVSTIPISFQSYHSAIKREFLIEHEGLHTIGFNPTIVRLKD